jgi:hypothetical protein
VPRVATPTPYRGQNNGQRAGSPQAACQGGVSRSLAEAAKQVAVVIPVPFVLRERAEVVVGARDTEAGVDRDATGPFTALMRWMSRVAGQLPEDAACSSASGDGTPPADLGA